MLTSSLTAAVVALAVTTGLVLLAGRRPSRWWPRLAGLTVVVLFPLLPVAAAVTLLTISLLALILPRQWYVVGAWFFASLLVALGVVRHVPGPGDAPPWS
jgi:hypothetical protein